MRKINRILADSKEVAGACGPACACGISRKLAMYVACSGMGIDDEDEFATKFIYNNGNNAPTDNITAGVAA